MHKHLTNCRRVLLGFFCLLAALPLATAPGDGGISSLDMVVSLRPALYGSMHGAAGDAGTEILSALSVVERAMLMQHKLPTDEVVSLLTGMR